jgi:hypothetical protein
MASCRAVQGQAGSSSGRRSAGGARLRTRRSAGGIAASGADQVHVKHAIISLVVALALFAFAWFQNTERE